MKGSKLYLGIELGSTRIKAALIDGDLKVVAGGSYGWENKFENGWWTYSLDDAITGLRESFAALKKDYTRKTGSVLKSVGAMGVSAMMHGYLVFDSRGSLLTPFRTWRNARTQRASDGLTELFGVRVPQRWSVSNLYQCILDGEEHVKKIARLTTLSGWVHCLLTGRNEVGICEASGMFPVSGSDYDKKALSLFNGVASKYGFHKDLRSILPEARPAGSVGAYLTEEGARLLDPEGDLAPGIPVCPPEGDAGTGMTATNCVRPGTGSVSAGTSVFALLVNDKPLSRVYREAEVLKTPDGGDVALLPGNNGCSEIDRWVDIFGEFAALCGKEIPKPELYALLYNNTVNASPDCGGAAAFNCAAAEPVLGIETGFPMLYRRFDADLTLANLFRAQLCAIFAPLMSGLSVLREKEGVSPARITAHGGLFKVPGVAQQILADAFDAKVSVMESAGEGGAYGMALLAAYMIEKDGESLADWLDRRAFANAKISTLSPTRDGVAGYKKFMENYMRGVKAVLSLGD